MNKTNMRNLGLTPRLAAEADQSEGLYVGRIFSQAKNLYRVMTEKGEMTAEVSGKFRFETESTSDFPAVGDFVMLDRDTDAEGNGIIHRVLPRKSVFIRRASGTSNDQQIVASNIDTVFICMSLNNDFNTRRLERYLSVAWDSGAVPVVVLTKSDLSGDTTERLKEVYAVAIGVEVLVTTAMREDGYSQIIKYIREGETIAFIGSSGVGKSTLINRLMGSQRLDTGDLRNDDKGRHTTTRRELFLLENGGMVIDTPGMRELGLESANLSKTFVDIDDLASECKFHDCSHKDEPGCAVQKAIEEGVLTDERLDNYRKLKKEAKYEDLNSRQIETMKLNEMFSGVGGMKGARNFIKEKNKRR